MSKAYSNIYQRSKMPSSYHEHCGKPGPKSNDYMPPPEARMFKSRSAPNSPCLERKPLFPRSPRLSRSPKLTRAATLLADKRLADKLRESKNPRFSKLGRSKSFGSSKSTEQRNSLGKAWHPSCLRCEECGKRLNPGQHSEHRGIPYCNIPCYSFLFGPGGYGHGGTESHKYHAEEKFSQAEIDALRNDIFPRLRAYNTYYENRKALQLACREANGQLIIEGVLRVYWGLKNPVVLASHTAADWKRKRALLDNNIATNKRQAILKEHKENERPRTSTLERILARRRSITNKHTSDGTNIQKRPISPQTSLSTSTRKEDKIVTYPQPLFVTGNQWLNDLYPKTAPESSLTQKTTFTPPYGTSTNLRLTSKTKVPEVIKLLFAKFQITNNPKKFKLYAVYDNGSTRHFEDDESPLHCRLMLGPSEYAAKIYIMEADDSNNISAEVAQYIHFANPVLLGFLQKFKEEEEKEAVRIKEWYALYKKELQKLITEVSTAV